MFKYVFIVLSNIVKINFNRLTNTILFNKKINEHIRRQFWNIVIMC